VAEASATGMLLAIEIKRIGLKKSIVTARVTMVFYVDESVRSGLLVC